MEGKPASRRDLRIFGIGLGIIFAVVFGTVFPLLKHRTLSLAWWIAAVVPAIPGIFFPEILRPIHRAWMVIAGILGHVVNTVILVLVYYLAFVPLATLFRIIGRDSMKRRLEPRARSYWEKKPRNEWTIRRYRRPF